MVNHIAIAVPDCDAAVEFYTTIFGFRRLRRNPRIIDRSVVAKASIFDIYGDTLQKVKVAFLSAGNGVGIELFEFQEPRMREPASFDYRRGGFFHIAVTHPDPEALCKKVVAAGGRQLGLTVLPFAQIGEDDRALYLQDPWGNTVEVVSCSFEQLMGNRAEP